MIVPGKICYYVDKDKNVCRNGDKCAYYHDVTYDRRAKKRENKRLRRQLEREVYELNELKERERHEYHYQIFSGKNEQNYTYLTESDSHIYDDPLYVSVPKLRPLHRGKRRGKNKSFHILDVRDVNDAHSIPDIRDTPDIPDVCEDIVNYELIRKAFRGMCIFYNSSSGCYKGDDCPFLHSMQPIQLPRLIPDDSL